MKMENRITFSIKGEIKMITEKTIQKCLFEKVCPQITESCELLCPKLKEIDFLTQNSGMDNIVNMAVTNLQPAKCELSAFKKLQKIKNNILDFVESGNNLFISSDKTQQGKTTWCCKLMMQYFDEIWSGNCFRTRGYIVHVPSFLAKARKFAYQETDEYEQIDSIIRNADLIVWDDITNLKLTETLQAILNTYIDYRFLYQKSNIFNGILPSNMEKQLGVKLTSRLIDSSEHIHISANSKNRTIKEVE